jgi:glycosyltransferase involved in cell wall biosynthesis
MTPSTPLPTISIVTPSLNQGRFLRQCLDSVFSQRYSAVEVLVIDGGSTDGSLDVIHDFEERLAYWTSESDGGQSDAINKGIERATGTLVSWLNADDFLLPGALHAVADAYVRRPGAPFYFGNGLRVDEGGEAKSRFYTGPTPTFRRDALLFGLNYVLQPATFISHAALEQSGFLDVTLRWGMDSDLWMRLSALGDPVALPDILAGSREYPQTKTASGMFERIEELRVIARRHTGSEITPGVLCYFLDTLNRYAEQHQALFGEAYCRTAIPRFWAETSRLFERFGAGSDGTPLRSK